MVRAGSRRRGLISPAIASTWGKMLSSRRLQEPRVTPAARAFERSRLLSLDVFRGVAVAGMILVNHPGPPRHVWPPLAHAPWDGCTPADLPVSAFLFLLRGGLAPAVALPDPNPPPPRAPP